MKHFRRPNPSAIRIKGGLWCAWFVLAATTVPDSVLSAAIIGPNPPALPLTAARVAALPSAEQNVWNEYLRRSERQRQADQEFLKEELRHEGVKQLIVPPEGKSKQWQAAGKPMSWYS